MSGGHYGHADFKIRCIKGEIEVDFVNKGKFFCEYEGKEKHHLKDRGANRSQQIRIVNEVDDLLNTLDDVARRVRNLEWFMSGDDGVEEYINQIKGK
jgi:hypothetical protein